MEWLLSNKLGATFVAFSAAVNDDKGVPRQKFTKAIIRIGKFVKDAEKKQFEVTSELLDNWVKQFSRMQTNGVKVTIPNVHHNDGDPKQNMGYVTSLFRKDDTLHMTCELIGTEAIEAAAKCDVSIKAESELVDGESNRYEKPITHVAMVTDPVVTGLGDFVAITASMKGKKMDFEAIKKALGIEEAVTADNVEALVLSAGEKFTKQVKELEEKVSELNTTNTAVVKEKEIIEASLKNRDKRPIPDKTMVMLSRKNLELELNGLVAGARLTPAARDLFVSEFATNEAVTLSLQADRTETVDKFIKILQTNDPVALKEVSATQTIAQLSNNPKDGKPDTSLVDDANKRRKAAGQ